MMTDNHEHLSDEQQPEGNARIRAHQLMDAAETRKMLTTVNKNDGPLPETERQVRPVRSHVEASGNMGTRSPRAEKFFDYLVNRLGFRDATMSKTATLIPGAQRRKKRQCPKKDQDTAE